MERAERGQRDARRQVQGDGQRKTLWTRVEAGIGSGEGAPKRTSEIRSGNRALRGKAPSHLPIWVIQNSVDVGWLGQRRRKIGDWGSSARA